MTATTKGAALPPLSQEVARQARQKFRKTTLIEAVQLTEQVAAAYLFDRQPLPDGVVFSGASHKDGRILNFHCHIETLEGKMDVQIGDWIAGPGARGEFWPIKPDVFAATYESAALADKAGEPADEQFAPNHKLCYRCQGSGREPRVFYGVDPGNCRDCGGKGVVFKPTPITGASNV